jgi:hypothetical protein
MAAEIDIDSRVESVTEWMLGGASFAQIATKAKGEWNVCRRTATNYISRANKRVREVRSNRVECMIEEVSANLMSVYDAAFAKGDYSAATGALREYIKLFGLAEPAKQEIKVEDSLGSLVAQIRAGREVVIDASLYE